MGSNLDVWLAAKGDVTITPSADGKAKILVQFSHLRPGGHYSLFENHFDQKPVGFTPVCTENQLQPHVLMMKPTKDGV